MVSGVIALMMNANSGLGLSYRDIMEILLRSGRVINDVRIGGLPILEPSVFNMLRARFECQPDSAAGGAGHRVAHGADGKPFMSPMARG